METKQALSATGKICHRQQNEKLKLLAEEKRFEAERKLREATIEAERERQKIANEALEKQIVS